MIGDIVSHNGIIVSAAEAAVPVDSIPFTYGYGIYEHLVVRGGIPQDVQVHLARLHASATAIGLSVPRNVEEWLTQFLHKIPEPAYNVKIMVVAGDVYIFATKPKFIPASMYAKGCKVITVNAERPFPQAKTLSMLTSYLALQKAQSEGAYDALLVDREGNIREGTRTNVFFTDGSTVFTPPAEDVLPGVMRAKVIQALTDLNIPFEERRLAASDLEKYTGLFLTSVTVKVLPIFEVDTQEFAVPDLVRRVLDHIVSLRGKIPVQQADQ